MIFYFIIDKEDQLPSYIKTTEICTALYFRCLFLKDLISKFSLNVDLIRQSIGTL